MEVFTIGFTKKTAEQFFEILKAAGIKRLVDIRLNNSSQLAGFSKRDDLAYFLKNLCSADYIHEPLLAPTQEILDGYKKKKGSWDDYETAFMTLMAHREVERKLDPNIFDGPTALLCSEPTAENCHRRLVLEYLQGKWDGLEPIHL